MKRTAPDYKVINIDEIYSEQQDSQSGANKCSFVWTTLTSRSGAKVELFSPSDLPSNQLKSKDSCVSKTGSRPLMGRFNGGPATLTVAAPVGVSC
ncbi:uncharacterized protein PGTG_22054 [Puccinia graminis f. sp. tritici CRL 75-36-700-3]|uniref:Uncharacterized protein n=1 Tax=Puccinia graminis f. sp. tritici (strain CRL 75-36-700-3 / race SCCL) TaxID=418459 RepID=H6QTI4_PUCGT|nr:uncharacterized protein PGTG_22054 [Puccinia graminis f. sp. tritici CRL 75-36-700-3]EHS64199.1 hypothetical protein PGTG_22054 [Puccinia graminis f. sp. tritici CRL 75-36-700-3]